jgi:shikimate dehydrogenase
MRILGFGGLSVTMPHKEHVAELVDELDAAATALHSVNTVVPIGDGRLKGYSTDGAGFLASLAAEGVRSRGTRVCVLGGGGAARAIVDALARAGAAAITIVNRSPERAQAAALLADGIGAVGDADAIADCDIVVNATSIGMGTDELPCDRRCCTTARSSPTSSTTRAARAVGRAGSRERDGRGARDARPPGVLQQRLWTGSTPTPR